jgi:hypothetical protein
MSLTEEQLNVFPEEIRSWDEIKNSDTPEKFWDQMTNMRSRMGNSIRIPGDSASEDDVAAFHQKLKDKVPGLMKSPDLESEEGLTAHLKYLGMPDDAANYGDVEGLSAEDLTDLKGLAHSLGLTRKQFDKFAKGYVDDAAQLALEGQTKFDEGTAALKLKWGAAFEERAAKADLVRKAFFPQIDKMNAETIESLFNIANQLGSENPELTGQQDGTPAVLTPDEALVQISEIRNNDKHPYYNLADPGNKAARKKMSDLYKLAYPGGESHTLG